MNSKQINVKQIQKLTDRLSDAAELILALAEEMQDVCGIDPLADDEPAGDEEDGGDDIEAAADNEDEDLPPSGEESDELADEDEEEDEDAAGAQDLAIPAPPTAPTRRRAPMMAPVRGAATHLLVHDADEDDQPTSPVRASAPRPGAPVAAKAAAPDEGGDDGALSWEDIKIMGRTDLAPLCQRYNVPIQHRRAADIRPDLWQALLRARGEHVTATTGPQNEDVPSSPHAPRRTR